MTSTGISAGLVKELRDQTGAPMMDCKRALEESGGDLEAARRLLREKGIVQAGRRAGRETTEGTVLVRIDGQRGALVAVGCETEPVSQNDEFLAFAEGVLEAVALAGADGVGALEEERLELVARIGENVAVRGAARFEASAGETLAAYVHPPAKKIGVMVKVRGGSQQAARRLAMHIAFAAPRYATRAEVPADEVAAERAIYEKQPEIEGKPDQVRAKIVEGMLAKRFFALQVLADQEWIHDTGKTVTRALADEGLEVVAFERFALAE